MKTTGMLPFLFIYMLLLHVHDQINVQSVTGHLTFAPAAIAPQGLFHLRCKGEGLQIRF